MHYRATITLLDLDSGNQRSFERTVSFEREKSSVAPHDHMPVDVDQKRRVLKLAIDEAVSDAIRNYP